MYININSYFEGLSSSGYPFANATTSHNDHFLLRPKGGRIRGSLPHMYIFFFFFCFLGVLSAML